MEIKTKLKNILQERVFIQNKNEQIKADYDPEKWIIDLRRVLMNGEVSDMIGELFYQSFAEQFPFQVGTMEIGGVPLATGLVNKLYAKGKKTANGFFIRKSRKKRGLLRMIEGELFPGVPIILVDDTINSGDSMWRQVTVLEDLGYQVDTIWTIVQFRDTSFYKRFHDRGIRICSLFDLEEIFPDVYKAHKKSQGYWEPVSMPFDIQWKFVSNNPTLGWVVNKSNVLVDSGRLYFGADNQVFWCIDQETGKELWSYPIGSVSKKKSVYSNPAVIDNKVIFGAYDGNIYCLDKYTGKKIWVSFEADWVGSSPAISATHRIAYIGLEYGLRNKMGGIIALNVDTGEPVWHDYHPALTHSSPLYIEALDRVVIGSNDGVARMYEAQTGKLCWTFQTFGSSSFDLSQGFEGRLGFSPGDIKESFVYSATKKYIIFGAIDGFLYVLDAETGHLVHHYRCEFAIFSNPCVHEDRVYFTAVDKRIRCMDLNSFNIIFDVNLDNTRIFSSPVLIGKHVYVGTNAGKLYALDSETGEIKAYMHVSERITMPVAFDSHTQSMFVQTYANEIYKVTTSEKGFLGN